MNHQKPKYIKCPHCDRYDFLSVFRTRTIVEYRNVDIKRRTGHQPYKGSWKKEKDVATTKLKVRCTACENEIDLTKDIINGVGEIKIDNKGVTLVNDFWKKNFN